MVSFSGGPCPRCGGDGHARRLRVDGVQHHAPVVGAAAWGSAPLHGPHSEWKTHAMLAAIYPKNN